MYHISDLKKFSKCPRFYFLERAKEGSFFQPYLRSDESFIDLLKNKLNINDCFDGKVGDSKDAFFDNADKYEWFANTRFEIGELRFKVSLLHKVENGYDVYFSYYGTSVKDLDFFTYRITIEALEKLGLLVNEVYIAYINPDYEFHKEIDPNELFIITNKYKYGRIINELNDGFVDYEKIIQDINNNSLDDSEPVKTRACHLRNICEYYYDCFKDETDLEDDSILSLVSSQYKKQMYDEGIKTLKDADLSRVEGNRVQYAQIMASKNGGLFVDKYNLLDFLKPLNTKPLSFIDFEWDTYLIPKYENMKPLDVLPFEFALYIDNGTGELEHKTFISSGDCRKDFIESLIKYLPKDGKILAYNAKGAEILRLQELEVEFPEYKKELDDIIARFIDLAIPFTEGLVYDIKMNGNYTLKKLVNIVSDKSYKDLDVADGLEAVYRWREIDKGTDENKNKSIDDLKEYCSLDAYGLYLVYKWLSKIAR